MLKYIVIDTKPRPSAVVFPAFLNHQDVAKGLPAVVLGAGFVDDGHCSGRSSSLDIDSRGQADDVFIEDLWMFGGML